MTGQPGSEWDLQTYYNQRALEYEKIYFRDDPVRQTEIRAIDAILKDLFAGKGALECACGTGFWTERVSPAAHSVTATDCSREMLAVAWSKHYADTNVTFACVDAYDLPFRRSSFNAGFANFWFSHIPKRKIKLFLTEFHRCLEPGSPVFMADNVYLENLGGELIRLEGENDTYKRRQLDNGEVHTILKNYYPQEELLQIFSPTVNQLSVHIGECYWWLHYLTKD